MRVLWVHNFPRHVVSGGVFMHVLLEQMRRQGVAITLLDTGNLRGPGLMLRAAREVRAASRDFDLVHAQFGSACGLITAAAHGRKLLSLRGTDLLGCDTGSLWYRAHGLACRTFTRLSLRTFPRVIVMSQRMRRELNAIHGYPEEQIDVLPDGIDLEHFRPLDRQEARRRLGEGDDAKPWVLFSSLHGPTNPIKRADLALAAFEYARGQCPDLTMKLLTGQTHDRVPLWVNACDVTLLASTREGWPNIIKESLACHVPFVSTDVSDLQAIATEEPNCVVAEATPVALGKGLLTAIRRGRSRSLRRHVADMDLANIGRHLRRLYERLCDTVPAAESYPLPGLKEGYQHAA